MKTLAILTLFLSASLASAREQGFAWDPNPEPDVTRYSVYLYDAPSDAWNLIGEVVDDPATPAIDPPTQIRILNFANVQSRVHATAVNAAGKESLPSEELVVEAVAPEPPGGLREQVVHLQISRDLGKTWLTVAKYYLPLEEPRMFVRLDLREEDVIAP